MFFEVIPTEVFRENGGILTYQSDQKLLPGQLVLIPLGRRTIIGIVLKKVPQVDFPTKPIIRLIHPTPIPHHLLKSILWLSQYYLSPLPNVANLCIPTGLIGKNLLKKALAEPGLKEPLISAGESGGQLSGTSAGYDRGRDASALQRQALTTRLEKNSADTPKYGGDNA